MHNIEQIRNDLMNNRAEEHEVFDNWVFESEVYLNYLWFHSTYSKQWYVWPWYVVYKWKTVNVFNVIKPTIVFPVPLPSWTDRQMDRDTNAIYLNKNREFMAGLISILKDFYKNHSVDYDVMLIPVEHWPYKTKLTNLWAHSLELSDTETQNAKMQQYHQERKLFGQFLKQNYLQIEKNLWNK